MRVVVAGDETGIGAIGIIAPPSSKLCLLSVLGVTDPVALWPASDPTSLAAWTSTAVVIARW